jgi:hypothetical protein
VKHSYKTDFDANKCEIRDQGNHFKVVAIRKLKKGILISLIL